MTPFITPRLSGRQLKADDWLFFLQLYRDRQVMRFFSEGYGHRLCCQVTEGNAACQRLMQRCGFRLTERQSRSFYLAGQWHDDLHFVRYANDVVP